MLLKTRGIIFRSTKYGESSLILEVYTEERGIRKYIVSGVRKARSSTPASKLQLMNLVELIAYERPGKELTRLKEVRAAHIYTRIPFEVERGTIGLFMLEVARNSIRESEENPILFDFLYDAFVFLDTTPGPTVHLHLHFLLELTAHLGFLPSGEYSADTPLFDLKEGQFIGGFPGHPEYLDEKRAALMYRLLHADRAGLADIRTTREERSGLLTDLLRYYRHHIEGMREINSLGILRDVMATRK
ncbi:DNA repair protein RecO (recombination protein O) [Lewinella marina]|uniref:DNA repair protein RecO n=1 Tax=Neolewinella marina TaxID=438751 RepID=A0A2G0CDF4_9BACT|nr:DNA repair protein RecO [Neolewinella marina]NJB86030.1 DNA repair protein RecO (recombination protein O) [Neolewinella marina]PHK98004.1 DNA repair protein RecO [Neolewinella marina]